MRVAHDLYDLPQGKSRHFSFIIERNNILSVGWNSYKTHPMAERMGFPYHTTHSELHAILNFNLPISLLYKYNFINLRLTQEGPAISKPCKFCQKMLGHFGVESVEYSTEKGWDKWTY